MVYDQHRGVMQCTTRQRDSSRVTASYLSRCTDSQMAALSCWRARLIVTPASLRILCRPMRSLGCACCRSVGDKQLFVRKIPTGGMGVWGYGPPPAEM